MRVKLSYTVEEEDVLREAAKIINLSSEDLTQCISLFNGVQEELRGKENSAANTIKAIEMIEKFRKALLAVDTRLSEVMEIVEGYELLDCNNDGAQLSIPLRVQTTQNPKIGVVTETNMGADYLMVLCDGDIWSVRSQSVYNMSEKRDD